MLLNVSYNDKEVIRQINEEVGKPFGLIERWKMGGNGSPKLFIEGCSPEIQALLNLDKYINSCNVELRPSGVIIRFRSLLETWGFVIPYYRLTIYKNQNNQYLIYRDSAYVKVASKQSAVHSFFQKIIEQKAKLSESTITS